MNRRSIATAGINFWRIRVSVDSCILATRSTFGGARTAADASRTYFDVMDLPNAMTSQMKKTAMEPAIQDIPSSGMITCKLHRS